MQLNVMAEIDFLYNQIIKIKYIYFSVLTYELSTFSVDKLVG